MPKSDGSYQLSFEEFEREFIGKRYEYVNGCAVPMEIDEAQGMVLSGLATRIAQYVEAHFLGTTFVDVGFWLSHDPPELRGADVGFISRKRLARSSISDDWLPLPPDLVVRVHVPETDIADRLPLDAEMGPRLLWIVDSAAREIEVRRPGQPAQRLGRDDVLEGGDVLPGFLLAVDEVFEALEDSEEFEQADEVDESEDEE